MDAAGEGKNENSATLLSPVNSLPMISEEHRVRAERRIIRHDQPSVPVQHSLDCIRNQLFGRQYRKVVRNGNQSSVKEPVHSPRKGKTIPDGIRATVVVSDRPNVSCLNFTPAASVDQLEPRHRAGRIIRLTNDLSESRFPERPRDESLDDGSLAFGRFRDKRSLLPSWTLRLDLRETQSKHQLVLLLFDQSHRTTESSLVGAPARFGERGFEGRLPESEGNRLIELKELTD